MINFFRRIRKQLADDNNFLKYSRYAIGEIILVVIGILIALQINTWNETNKARRVELDMLNEIKLSLVRDLEDVEANLKIHNNILKSQNILVEWLANDEEYNDTLAIHFAKINQQTEFLSNEGAFETLKAMGLHSLSSDSIRIKLLRIYDIRYKMYREFENHFRTNSDHTIKYVNPKHFELTEDFIFIKTDSIVIKGIVNMENVGQGIMKPKDVMLIKKDSEYKYWLKTNKNNNQKFINFGITPLISDIIALIHMIEDDQQ